MCKHTPEKSEASRIIENEAAFAARLLQGVDVELLPTRSLLETAISIALEFDHPAYDCVYIALAAANDCRFVTADDRLIRKLAHVRPMRWGQKVIALHDAAVSLAGEP
jgi:predicted nucleic acid-binding protein